MEEFKNREAYLEALRSRSVLPEGFLAASVPLQFVPKEKPADQPFSMNLSAIILEEPAASFGAVFTRNAFPGAPVLIGKDLLREKSIRGVLVNNKIANVCAPGGITAARDVADTFSGLLGGGAVIPSSTGIIGWSLPAEEMKEAAGRLAETLRNKESCRSLMSVAEGIMTTDAFPKIRSCICGTGSITAVAKGAGMIEPNLATMLVFILTDIQIPRDVLRSALQQVTGRTFNRISVDSDQSTSDSVFLFSSGRKPPVPEEVFVSGLETVCFALSEDIVRNGEGTSHVIKVTVSNAATEEQAAALGKAVINSPLVKTAVFGNDPNVGRIVAAVGDYAGNNGIGVDRKGVRIFLGGEEIFSAGSFLLDEAKEVRLSAYLKQAEIGMEKKGFPPHNRTVDIDISIGTGSAESRVFGSDLSFEYVRENADYRT